MQKSAKHRCSKTAKTDLRMEKPISAQNILSSFRRKLVCFEALSVTATFNRKIGTGETD